MSDFQHHLDQWDLRPDGEPIETSGSTILPVRTPEGARAVLKVGRAEGDSEHEHLVLRRWAGGGAVRLLRADPRRRALLLERLNSGTLERLPDIDACEIVASLYTRLHVPAMPQLHTLASELELLIAELDALPRSAPIPHRLIEQAVALSRDLLKGSDSTVLHGNLHYGSVLAADREPWLAIAPRPLNGDPHFELPPMLWNRWDEITGNVRGGVQRRFYALVDAAGFDETRARAWVIVRVVLEATKDPDNLTKYVALAKAVQD